MTQRHKFRKSMNRAIGPAVALVAVLTVRFAPQHYASVMYAPKPS